MKHTLRMALRAIVALAAMLAASWPARASADLDVVTTVPSLAAIVQAVGMEHVRVESLALPTQDPHFVDAKPSLALKLNRADLLVAVGLQLESGWLPTLQTGARNASIATGSNGYVEAASFVKLLEPPTTTDRAEGHVHAGGNPHFLYDPRAAASIAKGLAGRMAKLDPANATSYQNNLRQFLLALDKARKDWEKRLGPHKGKPVIGYHKTWAYLADWLGVEQVEFLEPKPGIPPTPQHVAKVIATARAKGVKVILIETFYPDTTAKLVAQKAGATLIVIPGGAAFPGEGYVDHIEKIVRQLEKGMTP